MDASDEKTAKKGWGVGVFIDNDDSLAAVRQHIVVVDQDAAPGPGMVRIVAICGDAEDTARAGRSLADANAISRLPDIGRVLRRTLALINSPGPIPGGEVSELGREIGLILDDLEATLGTQ